MSLLVGKTLQLIVASSLHVDLGACLLSRRFGGFVVSSLSCPELGAIRCYNQPNLIVDNINSMQGILRLEVTENLKCRSSDLLKNKNNGGLAIPSLLPHLFNSRELQLSKLKQLCSALKHILSNTSLLFSQSFLSTCSQKLSPNPA